MTNGDPFEILNLIEGKRKSKFPYCRSVFIEEETTALIDPGAHINSLKALNPSRVDIVLLTHFHFDHIRGLYLFPKSRILTNKQEESCFGKNPGIIPKWVGPYEVYGEQAVTDWVKYTSDPNSEQTPYSPSRRHEWFLSTRRPAETYSNEKPIEFGSVSIIPIHTPGHSHGSSSFYFPDQRVVYTGDIDLTNFGPWYFSSDGDIDQFIASSNKIAKLDVDYFITGHEAGVIPKEDFKPRLEEYLEIINQRDEKLLAALATSRSPSELVEMGFLYGKEYLVDPWVYAWESLFIKKHLIRLLDLEKIRRDGEENFVQS